MVGALTTLFDFVNGVGVVWNSKEGCARLQASDNVGPVADGGNKDGGNRTSCCRFSKT